MLDKPCKAWYMRDMTTPEQPQQYYTYHELAYLCRRSYGAIAVWMHRTNTPRIHQHHPRRNMRIALVAATDAHRLQRRILHGI